MQQRIILIVFIIILMCSKQIVTSQITSSPYTLFGAGQIEDNGFGINKSLGGTGIAFQSVTSLNNMNPASYSGIDSLSFLCEFGFFTKFTKYCSSEETQNKIDGNFRYLALGFRITKWWASSIGIVPYSSVGYSFSSISYFEGELIGFEKSYTGTGGINQFYIGNSLKINKNLSLGINTSYIFGSINQTETGGAYSYFSGYSLKNTSYMHAIYFDYGMQCAFYINRWRYAIGLIYGDKKNMHASSVGTMQYENEIMTIESEDESFIIPQKYGIGISAMKKNQFRAGIDFERKYWSEMEFSNPYLHTRNSNRYSLGFELLPDIKRKNFTWRSFSYRMGANYKTSYLIIDDIPINSEAFTFGLGVPLRSDRSIINISVELGSYGSTQKGLIKEKYGLLHLNLSFFDLWFKKKKYY